MTYTIEYPWAPAPWRFMQSGIDAWVVAGEPRPDSYSEWPRYLIVGGERGEGAVDGDDPNIALICLAPELAALVLAMDESPRMADGFCGELPDALRESINSLADRLRAIPTEGKQND